MKIDKTKFPYEIGTRVAVKNPHIKKLATIVGAGSVSIIRR